MEDEFGDCEDNGGEGEGRAEVADLGVNIGVAVRGGVEIGEGALGG